MSATVARGAAARREQGRREMRQAILAEARRMVDAGGVEQVSVRAIARAIGYSPGALYEYFPDREAILNELYFSGSGGLGDSLAETLASVPATTNPLITLMEMGREYRRYALDNAELYRLAFGVMTCPQHGPDDDDPHMGGFGSLVEILTRAAEGGFVRPDAGPVPAIAASCWALVHGFVSLELGGHITGGPEPFVDPATPEEGRQVRDAVFELHLRAHIRGLVKEEHREMIEALMASQGAGTSPATLQTG